MHATKVNTETICLVQCQQKLLALSETQAKENDLNGFIFKFPL